MYIEIQLITGYTICAGTMHTIAATCVISCACPCLVMLTKNGVDFIYARLHNRNYTHTHTHTHTPD